MVQLHGSRPLCVTLEGSQLPLVIMYRMSWPLCRLRRALTHSYHHGLSSATAAGWLWSPKFFVNGSQVMLTGSMGLCRSVVQDLCRTGRLVPNGVYYIFMRAQSTGILDALVLPRVFFTVFNMMFHKTIGLGKCRLKVEYWSLICWKIGTTLWNWKAGHCWCRSFVAFLSSGQWQYLQWFKTSGRGMDTLKCSLWCLDIPCHPIS